MYKNLLFANQFFSSRWSHKLRQDLRCYGAKSKPKFLPNNELKSCRIESNYVKYFTEGEIVK